MQCRSETTYDPRREVAWVLNAIVRAERCIERSIGRAAHGMIVCGDPGGCHAYMVCCMFA